MMGYILLTLSGNGFKAQFKHLTAACFKKSWEWTVRGWGMWFLGWPLFFGCTCFRSPTHGAGEHYSLTGAVSRSAKQNGIEEVLFSPPLLFWDVFIHIKPVTPQIAKSWQYKCGHSPNRAVIRMAGNHTHLPFLIITASMPLKNNCLFQKGFKVNAYWVTEGCP